MYVLLADSKDASDLILAKAGEEPHLRRDLDTALGLTGDGDPDISGADDTNVIDLAAWVSESNRVIEQINNR